MALKNVKLPATLVGTPITIKFDEDLGEYQVRVKGNKKATYFTDDKADALATAQHMRNTVAYGQRC